MKNRPLLTKNTKNLIFKDSCFIKISTAVELVFNYRGHHDSGMVKNDNRYVPLSIIRLVSKNKNYIPALSTSSNPYLNQL